LGGGELTPEVCIYQYGDRVGPSISLHHRPSSLKNLTLLSAEAIMCHMAQYEVGTLAVDGWAVTFGTARRGLGVLLYFSAVLMCP